VLALFIISSVIKNKHNHTDNTSGVIGVFRIAEMIAGHPELRKRCAFILFDHEEVMPGLLGSRAFAKWRRKNHPDKMQGTVINLDCIGNGDVLTVMTKKKHEKWHEITEFLQEEGFDAVKIRGSMFTGTSDHEPFAKGISLLYQKRSKLGALYMPGIHTRKDIICDLEKIERLGAAICEYIKK
jgi:Zn-dependent M28 family amino/carboxypeptidase